MSWSDHRAPFPEQGSSSIFAAFLKLSAWCLNLLSGWWVKAGKRLSVNAQEEGISSHVVELVHINPRPPIAHLRRLEAIAIRLEAIAGFKKYCILKEEPFDSQRTMWNVRRQRK